MHLQNYRQKPFHIQHVSRQKTKRVFVAPKKDYLALASQGKNIREVVPYSLKTDTEGYKYFEVSMYPKGMVDQAMVIKVTFK